MIAGLAAGMIAGFVLGFLGAGGTVVGLPILLFLSSIPLHTALGSNALGVSLIAAGLLVWRLSHHELHLTEAIVFAIPGLLGITVGVRLGMAFPGQRLIVLLSVVLVAVAVWMFYLSTRQETGGVTKRPEQISQPAATLRLKRLGRMVPAAFTIGTIAGFFGIGGGFMIVPALIITGGLTLRDAATASLLPIAAFSGLVGVEYWAVGAIDLGTTGAMLGAGLLGGGLGVWLAGRLPRKTMQRIFAISLIFISAYMAFH